MRAWRCAVLFFHQLILHCTDSVALGSEGLDLARHSGGRVVVCVTGSVAAPLSASGPFICVGVSVLLRPQL